MTGQKFDYTFDDSRYSPMSKPGALQLDESALRSQRWAGPRALKVYLALVTGTQPAGVART